MSKAVSIKSHAASFSAEKGGGLDLGSQLVGVARAQGSTMANILMFPTFLDDFRCPAG